MKKVTRLALIAKGKKVVNEMFGINQRRIQRTLEAALDRAEEEFIKVDDKILSLLNELSKSDADSDKIQNILNKICDAYDEKEDWQRKKKQVQKIKDLLNEEVEIEE